MSTYNPLVPTGIVPLDQDYKNLQLNFQQADNSFGIDHLKFSNNTSQNGFHTVVHMIPFSTLASNPPNNQPVVAPANAALTGEIFTAQINDGINSDEALYYQSGGGRLTQLTRNFQPTLASTGASFLPGGLILNWGLATVNTLGSPTTITFTQPYSSAGNVFSITIGCINTGGNSPTVNNVYVKSGLTNQNQFVVTNSSSGTITQIYWMAIGI